MLIKRFLFLAFLLSLIASCGGESGTKGAGETTEKAIASAQKAKESAEEAQAQAEEAGAPKYAKSTWDRALSFYQKGVDYLEENPRRAKYEFTSARRYFQRAAEEAQKNKDKYAKIEQSLNELKRLEQKARKLGAEKYAKDLFQDALGQISQAQESLESGGRLSRIEGTLARAKASLQDVFREIERKKKELERLAKLKVEAEKEKALMLEKRKEAEKMGAETKRATEFVYAEDTARDGDKYFKEGNYELALEQYKAAKLQYAQIIESIVAEKKFAELTKQQAPPIAPGSVGKLKPPSETPGQIQSEPGVSATPQEPLLTGYQGLVAANLDKLVSGVANYEDGRVSIDYSDGLTLQKDVKYKSEFLLFQFKEAGVAQDFSFWAGGSGYLVLLPKFNREVTVTCNFIGEIFQPSSVVVMQVLNNGRFGYGCYFGVSACKVRGAYGVSSRMPTAFRGIKGPPNQWVDRKAPHEWKLKTVWPADAKTGTLEVYYDGQLVSKLPGLKNEVGMVAFGWYKSKFRIQHLKVEGVLDPEWVVKTLEKKGVTVSDDIKIEVGLKKGPKKGTAKQEKGAGSSSESPSPKVPKVKEIDF